MIHEIIEELCKENGSNYKLAVLKRHKENKLLARVLKMTYDKVIYRYYLTMNHWYKTYGARPFEHEAFRIASVSPRTLEEALDFLEFKLSERVLTGNAAIEALQDYFLWLNDADRDLIAKIINRDLRINCGRTNINKVFGDLITKPVYMRCDTFSKKTAKNISFPAVLQLKADGTYRELRVLNGVVEFLSRSGEAYEYTFQNDFLVLPDGHYTGELLVTGTKDRAESNGLLNSDDPPMDRIIFPVWDYITPEEYSNAAKKIKNTTKYKDRLARLRSIVTESDLRQISVIETHIVKNAKEAFELVVGWMNDGLEGGVLKDADGVYRDGTSKQQLKMKLEMDIDVRVTGFKEGKIGTKREATFGAIYYETDDGQIKGAVSGFTDEQLEEINSNRDKYLDMIMSVSCNDILKGRDNDYYALSHPRIKEFRTDKNETDTLERAFEIKEMSMCFS